MNMEIINKEIKEPRLRFPGFEDEWKKVKFGEIVESAYSGGTPPRKNKKYYKDKDIPWVSISDISRNKSMFINSADEYISEIAITENKSKVFPCGTIFYAMYASVGEIAITEKDNMSTSQAVLGMINNDDLVDNYFLYYSLKKEKPNLLKLIQHGTQPNLNKTIILNHRTFLPSLPEQEKIGSFFKTLDSLIENQEKYIEKMKQRKKGLLQDIFSKKIRIKDENGKEFEGEWEEVKLEEVIESAYSGGTPPRKDKKYYENKDIPWVSISDISRNKSIFINSADEYISEIAITENKSKVFPCGTIFYAMYASVGEIAITEKDNMSTSQAVLGIINNDDLVDNYFLYYSLKKEKPNLLKLVQHGTQPNLNKTIILNHKISLPSLPEQKEIGNFFKTIDEKIEKEEELLNKYKMLKKALLQDMFI